MPDDLSTREASVRRNSWLCIYAIGQIGKPYWYGTRGQISTPKLYEDEVKPSLLLARYPVYSNYMDQLNVKVHDCSGLVVGAVTCESVGAEPTLPMDINHGSTSQFNKDCKPASNTMNDFPKIPGTLVFTSDGATKTHVGIYVGTFTDLDGALHNDAVVEAHDHDTGVIVSSVNDSSWDSWGQLSICTIDTKVDTKFDARTVTAVESVNINPEAISPFIITLPPSFNSSLDYSKLKKNRVSAVAFFGGELFDASHRKRTYLNSNLDSLVRECNNSAVPYLLYVNTRAKTVIEADEECKALYYVVSAYPPKLGLWICLQSNNNVELNDAIIELYYKYILKWGLKSKCGLYLNKSQLGNITWNTFQDRFNLWLIDPMDVTTVDDELLQPEMFEVPD